MTSKTPAHPAIKHAHAALHAALPAQSDEDFDYARRGFIATIADAEIKNAKGRTVWSLKPYHFITDSPAPDTVHPALWRQARLNNIHGLFQVTERIYQVRGFDLANITFLETDNGVIAFDCLTVPETAAAAFALYQKHRGNRRLHTIIYSHSHVDHFGGVTGLATPQQVAAGEIQIIAPAGFMESAVSENILAGAAMGRRAQFQFGNTLPTGETGQVDAGLGKTLPLSRSGLIAPTLEITKAYEIHVIDGLTIEFQLTPETEAPAEMHLFIPSESALNLAENATHTLHNLCPLRGAKVRDSLAWTKYLNASLQRYGARTEVILAQHHWPTWGHERCIAFLTEQRDLYRYLHDQTMRLMNHGYKPTEIANVLQLPPSLDARWHARGYYGTVSHNVRAIYQQYLSWYDAHPASLNQLPPVDAARKYIDYMGGADAVLRRARTDYAAGELRWVAEIMARLVYAEPDNQPARQLASDVLQQLGFQAESATWRNAYLLGSREYRDGPPQANTWMQSSALAALPSHLFLDWLSVSINTVEYGNARFQIIWEFTDREQLWLSQLSNGALSHSRLESASERPKVDLTVVCKRLVLAEIVLKKTSVEQALQMHILELHGDPSVLSQLLKLVEDFSGNFPVVDSATQAGKAV